MALTDWTALKSEYASTSISYRALAKKHDVSFNTLKNRAKKDEWSKARKQYKDKVIKKLLHKAASKEATSGAKQLLKIQKATDGLAEVIDQVLTDTEQFKRHIITEGLGKGKTLTQEQMFDKIDTKALKDVTSALKDLTSVIRNVYDLPTMREKAAMDIAAERLLLDKQKGNTFDSEDNETGVIVLPDVVKEVEEEKANE